LLEALINIPISCGIPPWLAPIREKPGKQGHQQTKSDAGKGASTVASTGVPLASESSLVASTLMPLRGPGLVEGQGESQGAPSALEKEPSHPNQLQPLRQVPSCQVSLMEVGVGSLQPLRQDVGHAMATTNMEVPILEEAVAPRLEPPPPLESELDAVANEPPCQYCFEVRSALSAVLTLTQLQPQS